MIGSSVARVGVPVWQQKTMSSAMKRIGMVVFVHRSMETVKEKKQPITINPQPEEREFPNDLALVPKLIADS